MTADVVWNSSEQSLVSAPRLYGLVALQAALLIGCALFIGGRGWDDGAITLAFAKTFALDGKIALTPNSEIVEGFSTPSWFLLSAAFASLDVTFNQMIAASQIAAALCICATTLALARTCRLVGLTPFLTLCVLLSFAFWGASFTEAANGMEMGLLALSCVLLTNELLAKKPSVIAVGLAVLLILTTRFEGAYYAAFLAFPLIFARRYKTFLAIGIFCTLVFAALTLWRLQTFSDFLPNTVWAKSNPPYAREGFMAVKGHIAGAVEYLLFFVVPLFLAAMVLPWKTAAAAGLRMPSFKVLCILAPIVAAISFNGLIASNPGYTGRMQFFAFPYGLVLLALGLAVVIPKLPRWAGARQFAAMLFLAVTLTSIGLAFPFSAVASALKGSDTGVTPLRYAETGRIVTQIKDAAGLPRIVLMSPDVGGLGLCCESIRVVDLALLTNRALARSSYRVLGTVLETEKPDVIQTHSYWSSASGIYENAVFKADYVPAFTGRTHLWIHRALRDAIERRGMGCQVQLWTNETLLRDVVNHRYGGSSPADDYQFLKTGAVFVIKDQRDGAICP